MLGGRGGVNGASALTAHLGSNDEAARAVVVVRDCFRNVRRFMREIIGDLGRGAKNGVKHGDMKHEEVGWGNDEIRIRMETKGRGF